MKHERHEISVLRADVTHEVHRRFGEMAASRGEDVADVLRRLILAAITGDTEVLKSLERFDPDSANPRLN